MDERPGREGVEAELLGLVEDERPDAALAREVAEGGPGDLAGRKRVRRLQRCRGAAFYSDLLFAVTHTYFPHEIAQDLWSGVLEHRASLHRSLGRDVGLTVAALDYLTNVCDALSRPTVIPAGKLTAVAEIALRDELTGLYDRTAFLSKLRQEAERYERYGDGYSMVMIDLDDFKEVNDTHGHPAGDDVLRGIASIVGEFSRSTDVVARYGGEEFVVLAPRTSPPDAFELAERIRQQVRQRRERLLGVTLSAGVSSCPDHADGPLALIRAADQALYRSKHRGKNCVTTAEEPAVEEPADGPASGRAVGRCPSAAPDPAGRVESARATGSASRTVRERRRR